MDPATLEGLKKFTGKVIISTRFTAEEGYADSGAQAIKEIQKYALSDKEPGCLTYRICRNGDQFLLFQEYENAAAYHEHLQNPAYKSLMSAVDAGTLKAIDSSRKFEFYEEV